MKAIDLCKEFENVLKTYGIRIPCIGATPRSTGRERGFEIQEFLDEFFEEDFPNLKSIRMAILDDNSDMAHLSSYLIQTNEKDGLTRTKAL